MTTKTKPETEPKRPPSTDRFRVLGATKTGSLPEFDPRVIITAADLEHPAYFEANQFRYSRDNPKIVALMEMIRVQGVEGGKPPLLSQIKGRDPKDVFAAAGNRMIMACRYLLQEDAKGPDEQVITSLDIGCKVRFGHSLSAFLDIYRMNNRNQEADDCVTVAKQMRAALDGDDSADPPVPPLAIEQVCEQFDVSQAYVLKVTDRKTGLVALSPACQEAIATGAISEAQGLAIAQADQETTALLRELMMDEFLEEIGERSRAGKKTPPALLLAWAKAGNVVEPAPSAKPQRAIQLTGIHRLLNDVKSNKELEEMSAADLLAALLRSPDAKYRDAVARIIDTKERPGRKPRQPTLPGTQAERE